MSQIDILRSIDDGHKETNGHLVDLLDFIEEIRDTLSDVANNLAGSVNVNATANNANATAAPNPSSGQSITDTITDFIKAIGSSKNSRYVVNILAGINQGITRFIEITKQNPNVASSTKFLSTIAADVNSFVSQIVSDKDIMIKAKVMEVFAAIGKFTEIFSTKMYKSALIMKAGGRMAMRWIVEGIDYLSSLLMNTKKYAAIGGVTDDKKKGINLLVGIGDSIYQFSRHLWDAGIKLKTGKMALAWIADGINTLASRLKDKAMDNISHLGALGASVLQFAAYTALATPLLLIATPGILALSLALFTLNFAVSMMKESVMKSAGLLNKVGLSILVFSGSLVLSAIVLSALATGPGMMGLAILFGSMLTLGLTFYLFGEAFGTMGKGALGLALISLALPIFAFSLAISTAMIQEVGIAGALGLLTAVAGFGIVFGLAGMFAADIALGSLAMMAVGLSLYVLSWGIGSMVTTMDGTNAWQLIGMGGLIVGLGIVYGLAGAAFPLIAAGAVAIGLIGGSLWALGKGLQTIMDTNYSEDKVTGFVGSVKGLIGMFDTISVIDAVTIPLKLPAVLGLALGLTTLAMGVKAWATLDISAKDVTEIANKVSSILQVLPNVFAAVGRADRGENSTKSVFGVLFGADFSKGDVERGISSTMELGINLKNLADGILAWKNMSITPADIQVIQTNVASVLSAIPQIFAEVGKADREGTSSSLLKSLVGADFEKGNVEAGIAATKDLGKTLSDLAGGIKAWATGGKEAVSAADVTLATKNIAAVLAVLPQSFSDIGRQNKASDGWFSDGDIEEGIELITKLSPVLKTLSDFIISFKEVNVQTVGTDIAMGMGIVFSSLSHIIDDFSKKDEDSMENMANFFGDLAKDFGKFGDNVGKSVKFIKEFSNFVDPMTKLASNFERITFSIERQVKAINTVSSTNFNFYTDMLKGLVGLSNANVATLERGLSYNFGGGYEAVAAPAYASPTKTTSPVAPVAAPRTTMAAGQAAGNGSDRDILLQILDVLKNNPGAQIDSQTIGASIAQAFMTYMNQQNSRWGK